MLAGLELRDSAGHAVNAANLASGTPVQDGTVDLSGGTFLRDSASGILTADGNGQFQIVVPLSP